MFMISKIYLKKNLIKNNLMNYLFIFYSALIQNLKLFLKK